MNDDANATLIEDGQRFRFIFGLMMAAEQGDAQAQDLVEDGPYLDAEYITLDDARRAIDGVRAKAAALGVCYGEPA